MTSISCYLSYNTCTLKDVDCTGQPPEWIHCDTVSSRASWSRSAPITMAWELVSGLPVSTQPGWEHLMYCVRMRGQMGENEEMGGRGIEERTGENNVCIRRAKVWVSFSILVKSFSKSRVERGRGIDSFLCLGIVKQFMQDKQAKVGLLIRQVLTCLTFPEWP